MAKPDKKPKKNADVTALSAKYTAKTGKPVNAGQMNAKLNKLTRRSFVGEKLKAEDRREALQDVLTELRLRKG